MSLVFLTGCIEKTVYPAVILTVTAVAPNPITATYQFDASGTIKLSTTPLSVTLRAETGVPSNIKSYSISYQTRIGDPIPEIAVVDMPFEVYLAPSAETTAEFDVYTAQVVNLLANTRSDISPLRAAITMRIEDVNGNEVVKEAHCQLSQPLAEAAATE
ncbi:MAG TPA: hypothetical protein PLP29_09880 [Candidatus Ozemobacteraceae bacterium]|nr:hypothetical protein [Candidatus Ozemobacteraceae bacterium]